MDKYNQKWVKWLFKKDRWAITLGQTSYFTVAESEVGEQWHVHEDAHKMQWRTEGRIKFLCKYLFYQLKYGYENNPYEVEARCLSAGTAPAGMTP